MVLSSAYVGDREACEVVEPFPPESKLWSVEVAVEGRTNKAEIGGESTEVEYFDGEPVADVAAVEPVNGGVNGKLGGWPQSMRTAFEDIAVRLLPRSWRALDNLCATSEAPDGVKLVFCMLSLRGGGVIADSSFPAPGATLTSRKDSVGNASSGSGGSSKGPRTRLRFFIDRAELLRDTGFERGMYSHTDSFGSVAESCRCTRDLSLS